MKKEIQWVTLIAWFGASGSVLSHGMEGHGSTANTHQENPEEARQNRLIVLQSRMERIEQKLENPKLSDKKRGKLQHKLEMLQKEKEAFLNR